MERIPTRACLELSGQFWGCEASRAAAALTLATIKAARATDLAIEQQQEIN